MYNRLGELHFAEYTGVRNPRNRTTLILSRPMFYVAKARLPPRPRRSALALIIDGVIGPPLTFRGAMPALPMPKPPPHRKTARAKLAGIAVFCAAWVGAGDELHSAVIKTSVIPDRAESAAGPADSATAGGSFIARLSAVAQPCSAAEESGPGPASCQKKEEPAGPAALPSPGLPLDPTVFSLVAPSDISAAASEFNFAPMQPLFDGLQTLTSGATAELLDELIARPDENGAGPLWSGNGDILLDYVVPALAVLALSIAALLLREVVRRRRRTVAARHIKRSFGR